MNWSKNVLNISLRKKIRLTDFFSKLFQVSDILFRFSTAGREIVGQVVGPDSRCQKCENFWIVL
jgi:hypothetical protein